MLIEIGKSRDRRDGSPIYSNQIEKPKSQIKPPIATKDTFDDILKQTNETQE